jgi:O-methyltransferase
MKEIDIKSVRSLYLDLLKRALTNWIHGHEEFVLVDPSRLAKMTIPNDAILVKKHAFNEEKRRIGQDWPVPLLAHTMIGLKRLDNLQMCIESVIEEGIPGDFIETGVWKGGSTIFMRGALRIFGDESRNVWVADSFQGLPPPKVDEYPEDAGDIHFTIDSLRVTENQVRENFSGYGLLDHRVKFLKGWFSDTLPTAPIEHLSILRLDGDMYESTMVALKSLYSKLSVGGYVIVDDYCIKSCEKAVTDFRSNEGITDQIIEIDGTGVYWRRTA